jgi:outer membrane receptor protein involved in Fe transport
VADVYSEFPRFEMVRTSENYQAQLLQPINVRPFAPQLSQINLSVANSIGPADLSYPEARTAFARNGLEFLASAVTAGNGTAGENFVVAGLADKVSFNVGQFHLQTDGFRENNDFEHDVLSAFVQTRPSSATSLQFELRAADIEKGDLNLLHDPKAYDARIRQTEESDLVRFGVAHRITAFTTMVGAIVLDKSVLNFNSPQALSADLHQQKGTAEFQVMNELPRWNLVGGFRARRASIEEITTLTFPVPADPFFAEMTTVTNSRTRHLSSYFYATRRIGTRTYLTAGASVDRLDGQQFDEDQTNPKLGLSWQPAANTQLRLAYFQTLQGPLLSKQLIQPSLEPMQVAGFGQYVFGVEAESAKNYALGFDQRLARNVRFGIDFRERSLDVPTLRVIPPSPNLERGVLGARESIGGIRMYWTPKTNFAFNAGWQYEDFDYHGDQSPYGFGSARTKRVPVEASVFIDSAISARFSATHVDQQGQFRSEDPSAVPSPGASEFWVVDASMNYRLPKRRGSIEVGIKNLFDEAFRFQDTDPERPRIFPERVLFFRLSFNF